MSTLMQKKAAVENLKAAGFNITEIGTPRKIETGEGVYVLKIGTYYKIGRTSDIKRRFENYLTHNPVAPLLLFWLPTDYSKELESVFHKEFENKKHRGEWFNLEDEDILTLVEIVDKSWKNRLFQQNDND